MSEHIHGHLGQTVIHDFGEFENIRGMRIRRDLIMAYFLAGPIEQEGPHHGKYTVNVMVSNGWNSTEPGTKEECQEMIDRLDWVYKKERRGE